MSWQRNFHRGRRARLVHLAESKAVAAQPTFLLVVGARCSVGSHLQPDGSIQPECELSRRW